MEQNKENGSQVEVSEGQEVQQEDVSSGGQSAGSNEVESAASEMGWVPKEEYRGDPNKWVDAATFVERGAKSGPILKERNEHLIKEIQSIKAEFENHKKVTEQFKKFQAEQAERKANELKSQIAELRAQKSEAIRNVDGDAVNEIDDRIDTLKQSAKEVERVEQPQNNAPHPDFESWKSENSWFDVDKPLTAYATEVAKEMRRKGDMSEGRVFFDKVKEAVRKDFPNKFGNPNRSKPNSVETGTGGSFNGKTFNDIPAEERKVIKTFIEQGLYKNEAEAVKAYFN